MGKITCAYSSVEFSCEHLPFSLSSREIIHPLFYVPKHRLLSLAGKWSNGSLSHTELYLLYLSLFHSTGLVEWRVPARYHSKTTQIIANNMESLLGIIGRIDVIKHPSFSLPAFTISADTADLSNSYYWIQAWQQNFNDWYDGVRQKEEYRELQIRTSAVERLIKTPHKRMDSPSAARILADWAIQAGNFPTFSVTVHGKQMSLEDYWHGIIIKAATRESLLLIPIKDIKELIDHCEEEIVMDGSIHAMALMKYLRGALINHQLYSAESDKYGLEDYSDNKELTSYRILGVGESAVSANTQSMISQAPEKEPMKKDFPNLITYLRAKARWDMAQKKITQYGIGSTNGIGGV